MENVVTLSGRFYYRTMLCALSGPRGLGPFYECLHGPALRFLTLLPLNRTRVRHLHMKNPLNRPATIKQIRVLGLVPELGLSLMFSRSKKSSTSNFVINTLKRNWTYALNYTIAKSELLKIKFRVSVTKDYASSAKVGLGVRDKVMVNF